MNYTNKPDLKHAHNQEHTHSKKHKHAHRRTLNHRLPVHRTGQATMNGKARTPQTEIVNAPKHMLTQAHKHKYQHAHNNAHQRAQHTQANTNQALTKQNERYQIHYRGMKYTNKEENMARNDRRKNSHALTRRSQRATTSTCQNTRTYPCQSAHQHGTYKNTQHTNRTPQKEGMTTSTTTQKITQRNRPVTHTKYQQYAHN